MEPTHFIYTDGTVVSAAYHKAMLIVAAVLLALLLAVIGYASNVAFDNQPDGTELIGGAESGNL